MVRHEHNNFYNAIYNVFICNFLMCNVYDSFKKKGRKRPGNSSQIINPSQPRE